MFSTGFNSGALDGQRHKRDVGRDHQPLRLMPARLVQQDEGMSAGRDRLRDLGQVQAHALGGAARQDQACALALGRADRPEDVGRGRPLVLGG